jgi:hypothetical protein
MVVYICKHKPKKMNAQYKTFEEAEKALSNNKHLKNNEIIETETNTTYVVSSMVIFPSTMFDGRSEAKVGYDVAVFFKNEMSFILLHEIGERFFVMTSKATLSLA